MSLLSFRKGSLPILIAVVALALIAIIIIAAAGVFVGNRTGAGAGMTAASDIYSDLTYPKINPDEAGPCIDSYIRSTVPKSHMAGYGTVIAKAGKQYNINPALMVAIGKHESALGTTGIVESHPYNYYGMTKAGGGWAEYSSWDEAINNHARYLRENYLDKGLNTIEAIAAKYAPVGAGNDPNNLNKNWVKGVKLAFNTAIAKCPSLAVASALAGSGDIVKIAISQIGVKEARDNCDCGEVEKYGGRPDDAWCAYFASWVYRQAGYKIPSIGGAKALYDWFGKNQTTFLRDAAAPQPGDLVLFGHSSSPSGYNVGIVESYANGRVHTIEGNSKQNNVKRKTYILVNSHIIGFGRWQNK